MAGKYSVKLKTLAEENGLTPLHTSEDYEERLLTTADVNRPALQLAGFYNYFDPKRLQIMGRVESTYLELKTEDERRRCFDDLFKWDISALVICHGAAAFPECIEAARKYDRNIFTTTEDTSDFMANIISALHFHLAPRTTVHGVLVEVHGEGLLLTGDSGIGKSETALELIKRGHRLIADDAVDIRKLSKGSLVGSAPELIRYYMELRGIGVVDVRHIYGVGAVKPESAIDLVVNMELPVETESYVHRIGRTARAGESGAAISFVAPEERGLLKAVERYIKKTVPVDRDQPFHSEAAERQAGKQNQGVPQAPWIRGGERNKKGVARHPGARFWGQPKKEKKFVHPANAKKAKHNRTNYQGRREPDFGQK